MEKHDYIEKRNYIEKVSEQVRCKRALPEILNELDAHISDQKADYMASGMSEKEAELAAIREMGDPVAVGVEFDEIHRPRMPWKMIMIIGVISLAGFILQAMLWPSFPKQIGILLVGFGLMIGVCYIDYTKIAKWSKELLLLSSFFILCSELFFNPMVNGSRKFFYIPLVGSINLQLVIFLTIPLYCAVLYQYKGTKRKGIIMGVIWTIPPLLCVKYMSSLITIYTLFVMCMVCLSIAVKRQWFEVSSKISLCVIWGIVAVIPILGVIYTYIWGEAYQIERFGAAHTGVSPYQVMAIRETVSNSLLVGGNQIGKDLVGKLGDPESYLFSYVSAYYGLAAAIIAIGIVALLILYMLQKSVKQRSQLGMLMSSGCCVVFLVQILFWMISNLGILPIDGYCPFLSYGGTGTITTFVLMGIVLCVFRNKNVYPANVVIEKKTRRKELQE